MTYLKNSDSQRRAAEHERRWNEFSLRVGLALDTTDPIGRLLEVKNDQRLSGSEAQSEFFEVLLKQEREAFRNLVETGDFSRELLGCISHLGQLFDSDSPQSFLLSTRRAWVGLAAEQLAFVSEMSSWDDNHRELALHALEVLQSLWDSFDRTTLFDDCGVVSAVHGLLQSKNFVNYIETGDDQSELAVVRAAILFGQSLGDKLILADIENLLPLIYEACARHFPDEFLRVAEPMMDGLIPVYLDIHKMLQPKHPQQITSDEGTNERAVTQEELSDDYDVDLSGYECERDALLGQLFDDWEDILLATLEVTRDNARAEPAPGRVEMLVELLERASEDMPGYPIALYALAAQSPVALREFLPDFLVRCSHQQVGYDALICLVCFEDEACPVLRDTVIDVFKKSLAQLPVSDAEVLMDELKKHILLNRHRYSDAWQLVKLVERLDKMSLTERHGAAEPFEGETGEYSCEISAEQILGSDLVGWYASGTALDGIEQVPLAELRHYARNIVSCAHNQRVGTFVILLLLDASEKGDAQAQHALSKVAAQLQRVREKLKSGLLSDARDIVEMSRVLFRGRTVQAGLVERFRTLLHPSRP